MTVIAELLAVACLCGGGGATASEPADRMTPPTTLPAWPTGIYDLPFAPFGLSACDEMMYYAAQFGLPTQFGAIGWRESNCRNSEAVHTSCCWGYWQLHAMHFAPGNAIDRACGADSIADVNSDSALDKQRQACAAKQLYDAAGMSPWSGTS